MEIPFGGKCACGTVTFQCATYPLAMYNCHCRACQQTSGAPYVPLIVTNLDKVEMSGNYRLLKSYVSDDPHSQRAVCPECRSVLFAANDTFPEILLIHAMALDDPSCFLPVADIWTSDAQPWVAMDTHIPKVFKSPPILGEQVI
ncbi:GFA family protein [Oxalobacteraceae bacterium R-40]|uniref:GFA family protein n=1 Tax=Keguizhuia sedimenti TaxID=3064264 RepID=A0ABU1BQV0_9BURK|nr:GFA family protein [Oxalobacteraceae bacterium R-40]